MSTLLVLSMWLKNVLGLNRPFPIVIAGYDIRRWENTGGDLYIPEFTKKLIFWTKEQTINGQKYGATHLQYKSPYGFLITWPLCFHVWYQFKEQQVDQNGTKIPGSEVVWYFRIGIARWRPDGYEIPTEYGPFNLHWD